MPPGENADSLTPEQQLNVALQTINAFAGWVANVDTKIATLSAAQVALTLFMATQPLSKVADGSPSAWFALAALFGFTVSVLATVRHLGAALRPQLGAATAVNHFMFPSVATTEPADLGEVSAGTLQRQAWTQAHTLSVIAVDRYRHFSRGLSWSGLSVVAVLIWLLSASGFS
jgi:hypothetical protein